LSATETLSLFYAALAVSLPTFGWVILGVVLCRVGLLPQSLNNRLSLLAFRFGLPAMLFAGAARVDYGDLGGATYLIAGLLGTLLVMAISWVYSKWRKHPRALQGIFVQSAFRSNLAIIGLALSVAAYGEAGTVLAALPVAVMTVFYNILAVWVLNATLGGNAGVRQVVVGIVKNPLIIGIALGIILSVSPVETPQVLGPLSRGLSAFFLPVMLICIGGSMDVSRLYRADAFTWEACLWRLLVAPVLTIGLAMGMGVEGEYLGVLFLLVATPVAVSGHVMVVAARGDGVLSANITVLSTLVSIATVTLGFFMLSVFSLVGVVQTQ
jgi:malonate transporter and related proteins